MSPAAAAARSVGWSLHGLEVSIESSSAEAMAYARAHLGTDSAAPERPDLRLAVDWHWGAAPGGAPRPPAGAERVGKYLYERDGRVTWSRVPGFEGLQLAAGREGAAYRIAASCRYVPRDALARMRYLRSSRRSRKTHRTLFKLMYYAVYYPVAWHLERTRGWRLLHASAVERDGRAVILSGLGGVGKSTLALSLLADPAYRFVSDNLLLHDRGRIYALPEPVRLDASSLAAVRAAGFYPEPSGLPLTAHPKPTYRVPAERSAAGAAADVVILLRFTPRPRLVPLSGVETLAHMTAARDLAREVEGHRTVSAFLSMAVADDADSPVEPATLAAFAAGTRGYLLGIGEGEPVATTVARIREVIA